MAYQSFEDREGDSDSAQKLDAIKLPADLTGKSLLDIGCNEGFFCMAALERGASRVVGIDFSQDLIQRARLRVPGAEFHHMSWWDLGNEKFDYVLLLSAIHYEKQQKKLLTKLSNNIRPDGLLVLECGAAWDTGAKEWQIVERHDGLFRFPTARLLIDNLLSDYGVREIGQSVFQAGDPQARYVFHCRPARPILLVIGGESFSGKSTLMQQMRRKGIQAVSTDEIMTRAKHRFKGSNNPFLGYLSEFMEEGKIDLFVAKVIEENRIKEFCDFVLMHVSVDEALVVIEGYPFASPRIRDAFAAVASESGFKVNFTIL